MDLVFSLGLWNKFLPLCLTLFHACSCLEQFFNVYFSYSSHGLNLVSGVYSLSVFWQSQRSEGWSDWCFSPSFVQWKSKHHPWAYVCFRQDCLFDRGLSLRALTRWTELKRSTPEEQEGARQTKHNFTLVDGQSVQTTWEKFPVEAVLGLPSPGGINPATWRGQLRVRHGGPK
jgi:hypothetical protein